MALRLRERAAAGVSRLWRTGGGGPGLALAPAEALYRATIRARNIAYDSGALRTHHAVVPVVSIGNIAVGGAGKTPFAAWVASRLAAGGWRPAILHGGRTADEPMLHARWHPDRIVVALTDRVAGAAEAVSRGAEVLVLDDGFQHRRLARDLDVVLIAAERWSARRPLLPRGPWREPASSLRRAHLLVVTRKSATIARTAEVEAELAALVPGLPRVRAAILPRSWSRQGQIVEAPSDDALAVAGIADPASFESAARAAGARVAQTLTFPDHHGYDGADVDRIRKVARGRPIVTTEKDWVKLHDHLDAGSVWVLHQVVEIEQGGAVLDEMLGTIGTRKGQRETGVPVEDGLA